MGTRLKNPNNIVRNSIITVGILIFTVLLQELFLYLGMDSRNLIMFYILSILIIARFTDGYAYGILAAAAGTFIFDFLVTEPRMGFSFTIGFPITLLIMLIVSMISGAVTTQIKVQARLAREREVRANLMYEINQKLLVARGANEIPQLTAEYLQEHIQLPVVVYAKDSLNPTNYTIAHSPGSEQDIELFYSEAQRQKADYLLKDPQACPEAVIMFPPVCYIPVMSKDSIHGLVGVAGLDDPVDPNILQLLQTLSGQLALAMELQYISDQQHSIRIDVEKEKTRGILLRAISHDLRTPLTGILSASSIIEEQAGTLDSSDIVCLASDIKSNSEWLIRMVENLLTVTRITDGVMKVNKTLEVAEEIMAQSVSIVRKRFSDCHIIVKATEEPLLIPMDAILISQVLINLLENAVKNSPAGSPIQLDLCQHDGFARFDVGDQGKGIPEQILDNLFETYILNRRQTVDSVSGTGIGLSICKTIIDAHGGEITGQNKPDGGATFTVMLPL